SQPVVASGGFSTAAAAGCLSSSLCFPLFPCLASFFLSLAPPIYSPLWSPSPLWRRCPVIWPDLLARVGDGAPVVVLWVSDASFGVAGHGVDFGSQSGALVVVMILCRHHPWSAIPVAASVASASADRRHFSRAESGGCGGLWFVGSPPRCSPIVVYCDLLVPMVSLLLQVVGLCSEAIFWRRVPGQAIIYRLVLICLLVLSLETPDPA
ncbi:hypothetical protein HID58_052763, partial [Brassica napus]